jgi:hypothetical protein
VVEAEEQRVLQSLASGEEEGEHQERRCRASVVAAVARTVLRLHLGEGEVTIRAYL